MKEERLQKRIERLRAQVDGMAPTPTNLAEAIQALADIVSDLIRDSDEVEAGDG